MAVFILSGTDGGPAGWGRQTAESVWHDRVLPPLPSLGNSLCVYSHCCPFPPPAQTAASFRVLMSHLQAPSFSPIEHLAALPAMLSGLPATLEIKAATGCKKVGTKKYICFWMPLSPVKLRKAALILKIFRAT